MRGLAGATFLLFVLPVAAADPPEWIGEFEGPGWIVLRLEEITAPVTVEIGAFEVGSMSVGLEWRNATSSSTGVLLASARMTEFGSSATGSSTGTQLPLPPPRWDTLSTTLHPSATPVQVLFWGAGDLQNWTYRFTGVAEVEPSVAARGTSVIFWDGSEGLSEGVHAHLAAGGRGVSYSQAKYEMKVEQQFRGVVGADWDTTSMYPLPAQHLSDESFVVTRPDGTAEACRCLVSGRDAWGPGLYTIAWEGHAVFSPGRQPTLVAGVDAPGSLL